MSRRQKPFILIILGALASALLLLPVADYLSWCCGPELPVYPGATNVQRSQKSIFDSYHFDDLRHLTYQTKASPEAITAFYRAEGEKRGYTCYSKAWKPDEFGFRMGGIGDYTSEGGDFEVTLKEEDGQIVVHAVAYYFRSISPHYCDQ